MTVKKSADDTALSGPAQGPESETARVSSPAATGGAGTTFEQHVGAYWLAQLLVRGIPPVMTDTVVSDVSFQTERLGWQTDDFLVVGERTAASSRNLAGQVKRSFTVSASDKECVQAISDFWKDFNSVDRFSPADDRLVLVTLRGTNTLLESFVGLLDCARAARDGAEFEKRLATKGLISDTAKRYCGELQEIIGKLEGKPVSAADIWPFLRVLHVLSLDLHSSTRQAEAQMKSMLAHTVTEGDPVTVAAASWNELVGEASTAMAESRSLRRENLPPSLQARHDAIGTNDQRVLRALKDHTAPVLRNIHSTIGDNLHLQRAALVQKVLEGLEDAQVVLVAGPAGSGKSAIGKDAVNVLSSDHFVFGFRVAEFAQPHFDATLHAAQIPANRVAVAAILAPQDRKVILVESVERLLEKTTRDAFSDLMTMAADDRSLRIILTCRDYSVDQVRTSFLQPHRIKHLVVRVPPLDDAELGEVEAAHPALAIPLANPALRNILRNPFFLDKALGITWSAEKPVPESEREFRALFWKEIVRVDVAPGMGRRREEVLQEIAVRRARALSDHVVCNDLDPAVIDSLRRDSLITSPEGNLSLVAAAHDVLEDWAILQWLEEHNLGNVSFKHLSAAIGAHPAVRRSYRKWVAEQIEADAPAADRLFEAALLDTGISVQFRDDTLVSLLRAPSAPEFLARHETQLLANDRVLLKRVIHLLRVACVKTPDWLPPSFKQGAILNVPDGSAWPAVLRLVHRNLGAFAPNERPLLISLVEDSVRGVSWWAPEVEGAEFVVGIAHWLLEGMRGYGGEKTRKRVLQVIAKIPKADPAQFEAVLRGRIEEGERRDRAAEELQDLIYLGIDGMPAARDLPDVVTSVGEQYLLISEEDLEDERRYGHSSIDVDIHFGIDGEHRREAYPSSAIRGPWGQLLRFHQAKALDFYIKVFNHSADWYAHPRLRDRLEPAWEVELTFADGTTRKQRVNGRLWGLYRGMTVGPYVLQSMLMALERWLLEVAKQSPASLDAILIDILRRSDNAALAAVVASVAIAYPHASGEALLALASVRDFIEIDRSRMVNEQTSDMSGMFPTLGDHKIYEQVNKQSNALAHRRHDLEAAVANLQLGPYAPRVHALLDKHLAAVPAKDQQNGRDRLWRLSIHRMDFRQYTVSDEPGPEIPGAELKPGESPRRYVRLDPKPPEADLQAMVDENAPRLSAMNARMGLFLWGLQAFRRETGKYDPALWAAKLDEARAMDRDTDHEDSSRHGPGLVAAVCIRDRWDEMTQEQRDWCVDVVCSEVLRHADDADHMVRVQRNGMAADRASAFVLALLLGKPLAVAQMERVRTTFAAAMTHPVEEVRSYATWSIDENIWATNRPLALRCVNVIAAQAAIIDKAREAEEARPYDERRQLGTIIPEAVADIRQRFWQEGAIPNDAHVTLDISETFGAEALKSILAILGRVPQDPLAIAAFVRAANALADWWQSEDDRDHGHRRSRNFHGESDISQRLQEFLLRTTPEAAQQALTPILGVIDDHSRELQTIMQGLTGLQDSNPNTPQYWFLWSLFAEAVKRAKWVPRLDKDRHPDGTELLPAVFLTLYWKDNVRHWRALEGYAHLVDDLFESLPPSSEVLGDYTAYLYHIGERSLPEAFVRIAAALQRGDAQKMLEKSNTGFMLEALLRRHVYGRPLKLKRDARIRDAVLLILDYLVETGSSAAFRMRDDFVTPAA